jgi:CBS domain-containing protein
MRIVGAGGPYGDNAPSPAATGERANGRTPMNARDVMTTEVISVMPDTSTREVARLLLEKGIGTMPIVDADGAPVGMVGEADLLGRDAASPDGGPRWWLTMLADGEGPSPEFLNRLRSADRPAREVMTAPVPTVGDKTAIREVARLLAANRIEHIPVVRNGRVVGGVSRDDVLTALADSQPEAAPKPARHGSGIFAWIDRHYRDTPQPAGDEPARAAAPAHEEAPAPAGDFRGLVKDFERGEARHRDDDRRAAAERREQTVKEMLDRHVDDEVWRAMLHNARQAAERGQTELTLLSFPSQLCTDRGRAINEMEPEWPATMRGEPADLYLRWDRDLKSSGFHLTARVLDYPDGQATSAWCSAGAIRTARLVGAGSGQRRRSNRPQFEQFRIARRSGMHECACWREICV